MNWKDFFLIFAGSILLLISCNKSKLDQPALQGLDEEKIATKAGVEALLIGAYSLLDGISFHNEAGDIYAHGTGPSNWIFGSICGSEAYKGSIAADRPEIINIETFNPGTTNYFLDDKWRAVYAGVARANTVLRVMKQAKDIVPSDRTRIEAEARFLRAFYHFEAVKLWNRVPFVDETITYNAGNYQVRNDTIWGALEKDFLFAVQNLPETQAAVGRANNFAAKAFLAKQYLFQRKYSAAKPLLDDIIINGVTTGGKKYSLMRYPDVFNLEVKNSEEHVFSAQMSVNDGAAIAYENGFYDGGFNGNLGDEWNYPMGEGSVTPCCSFFQPSQYLVNHFKTDPQSGLPDLEAFNNTDVKNDEGIPSTSPFVPYDGALDPRLDWTVGRRGIPYLDWGDHPGKKWIGNQDYGGPYSPKKNVFYKSQAGVFSFDGWSPMASAQNVNLVRFADVLLWAAEVEAEIGSLDKAREYVNQIRRRAADPAGWVRKSDGSPAANYKVSEYTNPWDKTFALKAIRYERMLELGMEGHRFFDLVRWGTAESEINAYFAKEEQRSYLIGKRFTKNKNEYFPLPQSQIDLSAGADGIPKMTQNPGY